MFKKTINTKNIWTIAVKLHLEIPKILGTAF